MNIRIVITLLLGVGAALLTWRTVFLLSSRRPVLGRVVSSTFSERTRFSPSKWRRAMIIDALAPADANEPTESGMIRVQYTIDGSDYITQLPTTVRKGGRPDPTIELWYDPNHPEHVTDKGISWFGLGMVYAALAVSILSHF
jgi:hypothetical protein